MEVNLCFNNFIQFVGQKEYKAATATCGEIRRCFYLDAASYDNLGDQAIALSMELFLKEIFGERNVYVVNEIDVISYLNSLKKQIKKSDVIALSGGGNMGDFYPRYEAIRRLIIKSFPDNKIVIFPQTINYSDGIYGRKALNKSRAVYSKHKNLWVCAREERSYRKMKEIYPQVLFASDIVFYLNGKIKDLSKSHRGVGICLRADGESMLSAKNKACIYDFANSIGRYKELTTMSNKKMPCLNEYERMREVNKKITEFSSCELIVTDRLHGMIFSSLANVPCIAIDNKNCKVSGVYEMAKEILHDVIVTTNEQIGEIQKPSITERGINSSDVNQMYKELRKVLHGA